MRIAQDFLAYRETISHELQMEKNRIRQLIGSAHWLTDGEHKESVLRRVMRNHTPDIFRIGRGFVCYPGDGDSSNQIDILVTPITALTLYREDDLVFVTADAAKAIIEVKTKFNRGEKFEEAVLKFTDNLERIRTKTSRHEECWGGLFIYEDSNRLPDDYILEVLQRACRKKPSRAINCISVGPDIFIRFWPSGHPDSSPQRAPMWHSYQIDNLAQPYFIGNAIVNISPHVSDDVIHSWFPIPGTKETQRRYYAKLSGRKAHHF